jgi:ATP-dependent RNA helicase DDX10/DBP4
MYIHRVGRTARYNTNGRSLMLLLPNEEKPMLDALELAKVVTFIAGTF